MDVLQYRDTGEFSDLTVHIGTAAAFKLHRLPLLIRSRYVKDRLGEQVAELRLDDLPGGADTFALVADFCYGKRVTFSAENIVALRCAADQLLMEGDDNLMIITRKAMEQMIHNAAYSRALEPLLEMLLHGCAKLLPPDDAKPPAVLQQCFEALLEMWSRSVSRLSLLDSHSRQWTDRLLEVPLKVLAQLMLEEEEEEAAAAPAAVEKEDNENDVAGAAEAPVVEVPATENHSVEKAEKAGIHQSPAAATALPPSKRNAILADLSARYLWRVFDLQQQQLAAQQKKVSEEEKEGAHPRDGHDANNEKDEDEAEIKATRENELETEKDKENNLKEEAASSPPLLSTPLQQQPSLPNSVPEYMDAIFSALPDNALLAEVITPTWLQYALSVAEEEKDNLKSRPRVLQLAASVLGRLSPEQQRQLPPSTVCEIISANRANCAVATLACVLDNHMKQLAQQGELVMEDLLDLLQTLPEHDRLAHHDSVLEILEEFAAQGRTVPEDKMKQLLELVDLSHCSVDNLQRALDKGFVPVKELCQASLKLARRLSPTQYSNNGQLDYKPTSSSAYYSSEEPLRHRSTRGLLTSNNVVSRSTVYHVPSPPTLHAPPLHSSSYYPSSSGTYNARVPSGVLLSGSRSAYPYAGLSDIHNYPSPYPAYTASSSTSLHHLPGQPPRLYDFDTASQRGDSWNRGGLDDYSLQAFEENLRGELNRISMNYDSYFREKEARPRRKAGGGYRVPNYGWK